MGRYIREMRAVAAAAGCFLVLCGVWAAPAADRSLVSSVPDSKQVVARSDVGEAVSRSFWERAPVTRICGRKMMSPLCRMLKRREQISMQIKKQEMRRVQKRCDRRWRYIFRRSLRASRHRCSRSMKYHLRRSLRASRHRCSRNMKEQNQKGIARQREAVTRGSKQLELCKAKLNGQAKEDIKTRA